MGLATAEGGAIADDGVPARGLQTAWRGRLALTALAAGLLVAYGVLTRHGPALADEYVYLAGATHFARTGSLDARFYDARAILREGLPHQDVHGPGYVILLGSLTALVGGGYWTAVALNIAAYLAGAVLVHQLSRGLGFGERAAQLATAIYLVLPAYLPFVFWAMPEVILGTLFLGALVLALRWGKSTRGAVLAGLLLGVGLLVRESLVFGLPAVVLILRSQGKLRAFLATLLLFILLVDVPLSRHRASGGVNFWDAPTAAPRRGGFAALHAVRRGDLASTVAYGWTRLGRNVRQASEADPTEVAILALFVLMALWAFAGPRSGDPMTRRYLRGLAAGWAGLVACILVLFVVGRWSGFRYLMSLMPAFLPFTARTIDERGSAAARWAFPAAAALLCLVLEASVLGIHTQYKVSRQRRQEGISREVERVIGGRAVGRIALPNGWRFGLQHYPTEVISSLPKSGDELRALERAVWFDYLALPANSPLAAFCEGRARYLRLNALDPAPQLKIYRRIR